MRLSLAFLLLPMWLGACDSGSEPAAQATGAAAGTVHPGRLAAGVDFTFLSPEGERANVTFAHAGAPAPDAGFIGTDGRRRRIADFAGRPVLVNLWATWCVPCVRELPALDDLAGTRRGTFAVLPIAQDLEGMDRVAPWFASRRLKHLKPYADPDNATLTAVGGQAALPTTILYDAEGRELWRALGGVDWTDAEVTDFIDESIG